MTILLDRNNLEHYRIASQLDDAVSRHNALLDWQDANPHTEQDPSVDINDWADRKSAFRDSIGFYPYGERGNLEVHNQTHSLRLRRLTRNADDEPIFGTRVFQCRGCRNWFITFDHHASVCSDACHHTATAAAKAERTTRRKARQAQRSAALANRTGICLCCGNEFNIQRITAKTCSEACRKRLQRKPELADQHLQFPPVRKDAQDLIAEFQQLADQSFTSTLAAIKAGQQQPDTSAADARRAELKPILRSYIAGQRLRAIAPAAPALTAWLLQQDTEQRDGLLTCRNWEASKLLLGSDLLKRLKVDFWTDQQLRW